MSKPARTAPVTDAEIDRMTQELVAGDPPHTAEALFVAHGRSGVRTLWSPLPEQLPLDGHRFLLAHWTAARGTAAMPPAAAIDPFVLKPVLGNLQIIEPIDGGADFRIRLYGSVLAEAVRFDWTGGSLSEMRRVLKGPGPGFFIAAYRAQLQRREPLYTANPAAVVFERRAWGRLLLPFGDAPSGPVARILVGNYVVTQDLSLIHI